MNYNQTIFRSIFITLTLFLLTCALGGEAYGFTLQKTTKNNYQRWFGTTVYYYINENGTLDDVGEITAIQNAFQTWEDVSNANISFIYRGTSGIAQATSNFTNVIFWIESGWPSELGSSIVAHTKVWTNFLGNIVDADIFFNGVNYSWSTSGDPSALDIQNVATHEIGHFIGIDHSTDAAATMDPRMRLNDTEKRTLEQDDIDAVSFLYPTDPVEIEVISGNNQIGEVGTLLSEPLVVRVTDSVGAPISDSLIIFDIQRGTGTLGSIFPVRTDEFGLAQTTLTPTSDEVLEVRAVAPGLQEVIFTVEKGSANLPHTPVAEAGDDQTVTDEEGDGIEVVTLDGSQSSDPDGTIVSYSWYEGGSEIATGEFPDVSFSVGTHTVTLQVTDDDGETATDTIIITVIEPEKQIPTDGLIAYWPFEDGSGSVAKDVSGSNNDGSVLGAEWVAGRIGGALLFDGFDDHVRIPDSQSLASATSQVTFAFWIYANDLSEGWHTVVQRTNARGNWFDWQVYARAVDAKTADHPVFRVNWDGGRNVDADEEVQGDIVLSTEQWYFIVCTYDGQEMKYYSDGTLSGSTQIVDGIIPNSGRDIWIGGNTPWGEYFSGIIDEVRIYNRALSEEEIQILANADDAVVNEAPAALDSSYVTDEDTAISGTLSATDADGDGLVFSIVSAATKGTVTIDDAASGSFTYVPDENKNGSDSFTFKVNDGEADSNTATVFATINPVNDPPVISGTPLTSVNEGNLYSFTPVAQDVDGDTLTFSIFNRPDWAGFDSTTGTLEGTPSNDDVATTAGIVITVSDGSLFDSLPAFDLSVIKVNDPPVALDSSVVTDEDIAFSGTLSATDADDDSLTYTMVTGATQGTVTVDEATGSFTYVPDENVNGTDTFSFKVNDGAADSNTATVFVTINPVNDPPVITSEAPTTATEGMVYFYWPIAIDVDADSMLWWTLSNAPQGMTVHSPSGVVLWLPTEGVSSSGLVTLKVEDRHGGTNTEVFSIEVISPSDG